MSATPPRSFGVRLAITLAVPLALALASERVMLPGVGEMARAITRPSFAAGLFGGASLAALSVFALGVMPVVTAYGVVELAAFLVPRWARLRHGNPEGRAKLDRAARVLAIAIAAFQAWSAARSFVELSYANVGGFEAPSVPLVTATLVGGVCVQMVLADFVSRQRIVNGYVLLGVVAAVADLPGAIASGLARESRLDNVTPQNHVFLAAMFALPALATVFALRGANDVRVAKAAKDETSGTPYRAASSLAVTPWIPVPASSFAPYPIATSLVLLPSVLGAFTHAKRSPFDELGPVGFDALLFAIVAVVAFVLARILHRPDEMSDLVGRLGLARGAETAQRARHALKRAMTPTMLFFAVLLLASFASVGVGYAHPSALFVPVAVALVLDAASAFRRPGFVPVWQERRASAVPVVRAVLEAEGIEVETRGVAVLSLLQAFAPYAPAELAVAEADAPHAIAVLRHVFLGEEKPEPGAKENTTMPGPALASAKRVTTRLGVTAAAALGVAVLAGLHLRPRDVARGPAPQIEVVLVDDGDATIESVRDADLPAGFEIRWENAPAGPGRNQKSYFLRVESRPNESLDATTARARAWTDGLHLRAGSRIAFEPVEEWDSDTDRSTTVGVRSFVLRGEPILTTRDVVDATAALNEYEAAPEVYVAVTLAPDAADRFADMTGAHVQERIAIVVDGRINSAPVVKTRIGGGRISITMGRGEIEKQLADAKKLARGLGGR